MVAKTRAKINGGFFSSLRKEANSIFVFRASLDDWVASRKISIKPTKTKTAFTTVNDKPKRRPSKPIMEIMVMEKVNPMGKMPSGLDSGLTFGIMSK